MNSAEKEAVLHCLKSMIDEEVCEECPLYGMTGTDHCEKDCVRLAINALSRSENPNKWIGAEVLDKIRAEIADIYCGQYCENPFTADAVREMALDIIDKYKASPTGVESEDE